MSTFYWRIMKLNLDELRLAVLKLPCRGFLELRLPCRGFLEFRLASIVW